MSHHHQGIVLKEKMLIKEGATREMGSRCKSVEKILCSLEVEEEDAKLNNTVTKKKKGGICGADSTSAGEQ